MPTLREVEHLRRERTIDATLSEAVTALPTIIAARSGSTPDDSGSAGYFEDDGDGVLTYAGWFSPGDYPDTNLVRPF